MARHLPTPSPRRWGVKSQWHRIKKHGEAMAARRAAGVPLQHASTMAAICEIASRAVPVGGAHQYPCDGADLNEPGENGRRRGLARAAAGGQTIDCCSLLLQSKADVNKRSQYDTAHCMRRRGQGRGLLFAA